MVLFPIFVVPLFVLVEHYAFIVVGGLVFKYEVVLVGFAVTYVEVAMGKGSRDAVVLVVDGTPQQVFQLGEACSGHRRDEHSRKVVG